MPEAVLQAAELGAAAPGGDAARAKYAPVCYARMPDEVLSGFTLYMRSLDAKGTEIFTLYAGAEVEFTAEHRRRLYQLGVNFLYVSIIEQRKLRRKLEDRVEKAACDTTLDLAVRCEIIYESATELLDETFMSRNMEEAVPRMRRVALAIIALYQENPQAFTHFYAAARHDACPTTHAANAATWMPALAMALGETQKPALTNLCVGALLYDIGMAFLPTAIRTSRVKFNAAEKQTIQQHPEIGAQLLKQILKLDPVVPVMALQHQERLDGSGYPRGLTFDRIHQAARMIAVIDTFDALTGFRPWRKASHSPRLALEVLRRESKHRFDHVMVDAWAKLLREACPEINDGAEEAEDAAKGEAKDEGITRRRFERYSVKCSARLELLQLVNGIWMVKESVDAVAHNLSRGGLGLLSKKKLNPGEYYRAKLKKKNGMVQALELMIVRSRDYGEGWFEAGARFVDLAREAAPLPNGEFV